MASGNVMITPDGSLPLHAARDMPTPDRDTAHDHDMQEVEEQCQGKLVRERAQQEQQRHCTKQICKPMLAGLVEGLHIAYAIVIHRSLECFFTVVVCHVWIRHHRKHSRYQEILNDIRDHY